MDSTSYRTLSRRRNEWSLDKEKFLNFLIIQHYLEDGPIHAFPIRKGQTAHQIAQALQVKYRETRFCKKLPRTFLFSSFLFRQWESSVASSWTFIINRKIVGQSPNRSWMSKPIKPKFPVFDICFSRAQNNPASNSTTYSPSSLASLHSTRSMRL